MENSIDVEKGVEAGERQSGSSYTNVVKNSVGITAVNTSDVATMSGVTFNKTERTNLHSNTSYSNNTKTTGRHINTNDVQNIFRGSTNTGVVSQEQILRIQKMHDKISEGARWDFNYSCLLMVASIVAGIGLAVDSATTVISSMLLSPIMGPVVAMSYGLIIWDLPLIRRSMANELLSIMYCIIFGILIGLCTSWTDIAETWPSNEMLSRATRTTFYAGIPTAFFSGLGVALSVLDDQTSSLVGVAISASLLPPAVNSGMLWVMAMIKDDNWSDFHLRLDKVNADDSDLAKIPNFSQMGTISLMLTGVNVLMVACGATLMFRLKEVLPVSKKVFWEDLKVARRIYQGRALDPNTGEILSADHVSNREQIHGVRCV